MKYAILMTCLLCLCMVGCLESPAEVREAQRLESRATSIYVGNNRVIINALLRDYETARRLHINAEYERQLLQILDEERSNGSVTADEIMQMLEAQRDEAEAFATLPTPDGAEPIPPAQPDIGDVLELIRQKQRENDPDAAEIITFVRDLTQQRDAQLAQLEERLRVVRDAVAANEIELANVIEIRAGLNRWANTGVGSDGIGTASNAVAELARLLSE